MFENTDRTDGSEPSKETEKHNEYKLIVQRLVQELKSYLQTARLSISPDALLGLSSQFQDLVAQQKSILEGLLDDVAVLPFDTYEDYVAAVSDENDRARDLDLDGAENQAVQAGNISLYENYLRHPLDTIPMSQTDFAQHQEKSVSKLRALYQLLTDVHKMEINPDTIDTVMVQFLTPKIKKDGHQRSAEFPLLDVAKDMMTIAEFQSQAQGSGVDYDQVLYGHNELRFVLEEDSESRQSLAISMKKLYAGVRAVQSLEASEMSHQLAMLCGYLDGAIPSYNSYASHINSKPRNLEGAI